MRESGFVRPSPPLLRAEPRCSGKARWLLLIASLIAAPADAQSSLQLPLQFDFVNPGAKSLALGGAFVGLADDATAAFANPAGLTQLGVSEASIELRATRTDAPYLAGGRLSGTPINVGLDTVVGPIFATSVNTHVGPGFLAGVYVHPSHRVVFAGYRHEFVRIEQSFFSEGVFQRAPDRLTDERDRPQSAVRELSITTYGGSAAYTVVRGLSVGGSLAVHAFTIDSTFTRHLPDGGFANPGNRQVEDGRATQKGADISIAPTVGLMIGEGRLRGGAVFRRGPTSTYETVDGNEPPRRPRFRVPNTVALGASFRPWPQLTIAGEVSRLGYSRLREDFVVDQAQKTGRADSFNIDDGTEVHLGVQYALPAVKGRPRLRGGVWRDPDHTVQFTPLASGGGSADRIFDERFSVALSRGRTLVHGTGGIGVTFSQRAELNVGIDAAPGQFRFSTSLIVR